MAAATTPAGTGLTSASGALTVVGVISGILSAVEGILTPGTSAHTAVYGGGGIIVALGSVIAKLFHDKGIHVATIEQAGSDIAAQLPQLKADLSKTVSFVETDLPGLKAQLAAVDAKVAAVVAPVAPDAAAIEKVVRSVLAGLLPAGPPAPTVPPAA